MIEEELPDELENDLDDIEPVGDESQLYEHFRVVVDKGQAMVSKSSGISQPTPAAYICLITGAIFCSQEVLQRSESGLGAGMICPPSRQYRTSRCSAAA